MKPFMTLIEKAVSRCIRFFMQKVLLPNVYHDSGVYICSLYDFTATLVQVFPQFNFSFEQLHFLATNDEGKKNVLPNITVQ